MGRYRRGGYDDDEDEDDGSYRYGGWGYPKSSPKRVEGGIKTKSERGAIGETWWSKRWVHVLESFGMGTRLTRGRSYARQGQVLSVEIEPGIVKAKVQGSMPKPYTIKIQLQPLSSQDWDKVTDAMASQALFAAKLLAGEMPTNIEEAFSTVKLSLFPTSIHDLKTDCSCPDWANPCKHIAAVYYILAERFDEDPFLIFKLRGCTKEEIIEVLREKRAETLPSESTVDTAAGEQDTAGGMALRLEDHLDRFWQAGEGLDAFVVSPQAPKVEKAVLKRLGDGPFSVGGQNITALLGKAYDVVKHTSARKMVEGESPTR
jgi:uncharacterized Zn finger protein